MTKQRINYLFISLNWKGQFWWS